MVGTLQEAGSGPDVRLLELSPKQSDLVLNGAAESIWERQGFAAFQIDAQAQVLQTAAIVRRDWQRTVTAPQVLPCQRQMLAKAAASQHAKLVAFGRVAFPHLETYSRAYRAVIKRQGIPIEVDIAQIGAGCNELTLNLTGLKSDRASLTHTELRLARLLVHRLR